MIFCPLPGTPIVTQGFGQNPDLYAQFGMQGHDGIDFGVPEGTTIYAPHDGTAQLKNDGDKGYGMHVIIEDGKRRSALCHLSEILVSEGQQIYQGDPVAKSGKTGLCTAPHLHWCFKIVKNGVVQNKNNGFAGAVDVTELTRLWLDQDLHRNATYTDDAKPYLAMTFEDTQYLKRTIA